MFKKTGKTMLKNDELSRKQPEQKPETLDYLATVLNGFTDPFFILDTENTIQMLNSAALDYSNNAGEKVVGLSCTVICGNLTSHCNECPVINLPQQGKKVSFERTGARDSRVTELVRVNPLFDTHNTPQGAIVRIKDITEKQKTKEQLVLADRLSSLNQLSSGIAHEVRNPLAAITLFTDIMADTERFDRTDQELEILTGIKTGCKTIGNIVTRILDFAKPVTFARKAISINHLINRSIQFCSSKMNKLNISVEMNLAEALPDIKGETVELEQVLNNLIINAIDAMPEGGKLLLKTSVEESSFRAGQKVIQTAICDTGIGITPETEDTIFNPFFSTKPMGTGLGLTIAHQIISRHGGVLYRNSNRDNGTEFIFELPPLKD